MTHNYSITVTHIYPKELNLYGDTGNILCLKKRCEWRGIEFRLRELNQEETLANQQTDIYFMGGGQDVDQADIVEDFSKLKYDSIKQDTESGTVFLGVCGGYQLMGEAFITGDGEKLPGLGIIPIETRAPGKEVKVRCIGNLGVEIDVNIYNEISGIYSEGGPILKTLVGFENHSGQTFFISEDITPLAYPLFGYGNNISKQTEGARFKNIFGSYMHGPLLPKNPHFADYLICLALRNKYHDSTITIDRLDDKEEIEAHNFMIEKNV